MNLIDKDAVMATIKKHVIEERHSYFCKCLLSEIDALEVKEQPSLPSNLDEAATSFAQQRFPEDEQAYARRCARKGFEAGAEWQYQKDRGEFAKIKAKTWCEGFDAHKEQMMKDAMEGQIYGSDGDHWVESEIYENLKGKEGDKVRIVVIKTEEE